MTEEADVTFLVEEARMLLLVGGTVLGSLTDVAFVDDLSVDGYADIVALGVDFLFVPLTCWLESTVVIGLGWYDAIHRTVVLQWGDVAIGGMLAVEYLNLHTYIGCIAFHWGADAYAIVGSWGELELEAVDKIGVFIDSIEVAAKRLAWVHADGAVLDGIVNGVACPLIHVGAIEEYLETVFLLLFAKLEWFGTLELLDVDIAEPHLTAMCLQLELLDGEDGLIAVPVILEDDIIYYQDAVELHRYTVAHHLDVE